jgi:hypothetical protein
MFDALATFFRNESWPYTQIDNQPALQLGYRGEAGEWLCYCQARDDVFQFVFHSVCPLTVPPAKRLAMAEFLTRANYGMLIGNFEMDFEDGEIRYKTGVNLEDTNLTDSMIRPQVYANVLMMDKYLPGINSVIYSDVAPKDAIFTIESAVPKSD